MPYVYENADPPPRPRLHGDAPRLRYLPRVCIVLGCGLNRGYRQANPLAVPLMAHGPCLRPVPTPSFGCVAPSTEAVSTEAVCSLFFLLWSPCPANRVHGRGEWVAHPKAAREHTTSQRPRGRLRPKGTCGGRIGRRARAARIVGKFFPYECGCHDGAYQGRLHSVPPFVGRGKVRPFSVQPKKYRTPFGERCECSP